MIYILNLVSAMFVILYWIQDHWMAEQEQQAKSISYLMQWYESKYMSTENGNIWFEVQIIVIKEMWVIKQ